MIKMASRKILLLLYHVSILIYEDLYLSVGSACERVHVVLSSDLAMCSIAI